MASSFETHREACHRYASAIALVGAHSRDPLALLRHSLIWFSNNTLHPSSPGIAVRRTASLPLAYDRAIQYAAAYRFHHCCLWNTGSPAFAGDDS